MGIVPDLRPQIAVAMSEALAAFDRAIEAQRDLRVRLERLRTLVADAESRTGG